MIFNFLYKMINYSKKGPLFLDKNLVKLMKINQLNDGIQEYHLLFLDGSEAKIKISNKVISAESNSDSSMSGFFILNIARFNLTNEKLANLAN